VVFFCENNTYAMSMHVARAFPIADIATRAAAYGFPGVTVDGNDFFAVYTAAAEAVARARSGGGPTLIEAKTYRWRGHSKSDRNLYRTQQEIDEWKQRDPIPRLQNRLLELELLDEAAIAAIQVEAQAAIMAAVEFARTSPDPDPAGLEDEVYA